jgi:hypothetical protein
MKIRSLLILFFGTIVLLNAQQAVAPAIPPMPAGPPMQLRAPDFSQWVIKLIINSAQPASTTASTDTGQNKAGKPNNESQVTMTKTGKIMVRQRLDGQGSTWNVWCIDDVQVTVYPDGKNMVIQTRPAYIAGENPLYENYSQTDFPRLIWVSQKNYAGMKSYNGKSCLYFKDRYKFYGEDEESDVEAYTDLKTRLPVASIVSTPSGQTTYAYEFQQPPAATLTLPNKVQSALDARRKAQSAGRINPAP